MGKRLRNFLHLAHLDTWETFAAEVHGTLTTEGAYDEPHIVVPHEHGVITIERDVTMLLTGKVMIPVISTVFTAQRRTVPAHRFSVSRATFAASVAEWFGRLDIQVDNPAFDTAFVVKGDTPDFVRALFADEALCTLFLDHFEGTLALKDDTAFLTDPTPGYDPLALTVSGIVDDGTRLRHLHALLAATLSRVATLQA